MRTIRDNVGQVLTWVQPRWSRLDYELRSSDEPVATLRWAKSCGSLAVAEAADGQWTFKRGGFIRPRVTVRKAGTEADLATLEMGSGQSGTLRLLDGRQFCWVCTNFWRSNWAYTAADGNPLIHFKSEAGLIRATWRVEIEPAAVLLPELSLLILLGWYVLVLMAADAAVLTAPCALS